MAGFAAVNFSIITRILFGILKNDKKIEYFLVGMKNL